MTFGPVPQNPQNVSPLVQQKKEVRTEDSGSTVLECIPSIDLDVQTKRSLPDPVLVTNVQLG